MIVAKTKILTNNTKRKQKKKQSRTNPFKYNHDKYLNKYKTNKVFGHTDTYIHRE